MKAVVATFNQEKALVGAFSVITILLMELFEALNVTDAAAQVAMIMVPSQEMARRKLAEGWDGVFPGADITWIINAAKQFVDIV